jgi:hypothetical protein
MVFLQSFSVIVGHATIDIAIRGGKMGGVVIV